MNEDLLSDLKYRIKNLRHAIDLLCDDESEYDEWETGYKEGRLTSMQSELRFLNQMVERYS